MDNHPKVDAEVFRRAKSCLTQDENRAIELKFQFEKSSWEAGEILSKAHYKYIEIAQRGERLLKLYYEMFSLFPNIFRENCPADRDFKDYIISCTVQRLPVREASLTISGAWTVSSYREKKIMIGMDTLKISGDARDILTHDFIKEFDRWNNFRILPRGLQETSPFKRREKRRDLQVIKAIINLPPISIKLICDLYGKKLNPPSKANKPIATSFVIQQVVDRVFWSTIYIDTTNKRELERASAYGLLFFMDYSVMREFANLLVGFYLKKSPAGKLPTPGSQFWGEFRSLASNAVNYEDVFKRYLSRNFCQQAVDDKTIISEKIKRRIKKTKEDHSFGVTKAPEDIFWKKS